MKSVKKFINRLAALCCLLMITTAMAQESDHTLTVLVFGAEPNEGMALFALFDSKKTYLKTPKLSLEKPIDGDGRAKFIVDGLTTGTYAVSVVHDKDNSGELNTGFLGIPSEPVGISNNPTSRFGPPSFKKARFELDKSKTIEISLRKIR